MRKPDCVVCKWRHEGKRQFYRAAVGAKQYVARERVKGFTWAGRDFDGGYE